MCCLAVGEVSVQMSFAERPALNCSRLTVLLSVTEVRQVLGYFTMTKQQR